MKKKVIEAPVNRTFAQKMQFKEEYKSVNIRALMKDLKNEHHGHLE